MSEQNKRSSSTPDLVSWIVIIAVLGFVLWVASQNVVGHQKGPGLYSNACINNLRQIDGAACQFALEHNLTNGARINFPSDLTPYIKLNSTGKIPPCPSGGTYHIARVGKVPTCSLGTNVTPGHKLQ
jgi:hypothetical protein